MKNRVFILYVYASWILLCLPGLARAAEKVGASACINCHESEGEAFKKNVHSKSFPAVKNIPFEESCETCHGPGSAHAEAGGDKSNPGFATIKNPKKMDAAAATETCLQCHSNTNRMFWKGSAHESRDVSCMNCHSMHHSKSEGNLLAKESQTETCFQCHVMRKAQAMRSSHMPVREGKLQCTDCHNPHGTANNKLLVQKSVNENCYSCHAEKRGPFLWEHAPVQENCLICHEAHGSQHDKLLKVKRPRLCQQCHTHGGPGVHVTIPGSTTNLDPNLGTVESLTNIGGSRACVQCHAQIHGSNHPQGHRYQR